MRLPRDISVLANIAASIQSRTVPQQVAHWARIGQQLEMSPHVNHGAVARVLAELASYDDLGEKEQALVRAQWQEIFDERRQKLNLSPSLNIAGTSYSELDEHGNIVTHQVER